MGLFNLNRVAPVTRLLLIAGCAAAAPVASGFGFDIGEIQGQFDSSISLGVSWRLADIAEQNAAPGNLEGGKALSSTNDDGTLNFEKGDTFSKIIKGVHELQLSYETSGLFTRFNYWYDKELNDESRPHGHGPNGYRANAPLKDDDFTDNSKFSGFGLLDAFIYSGFELGDMPADIRLGKQVVSWGESTFIQNSINTINPVDVSAFRRPGAEIKEALLPVNMLFGSVGLSENFNLELFYQLEWEKTQIDACGTYFSTSDVAAEGCNYLTLSNQFPDSVLAAMPVPQGAGALTRTGDREPEDNGQFGLSLRYFAQQLNDTEFGLYYLNYHSRVPLLGVTTKTGVPHYYIGYPEDIHLLGLSFNTNVGEWAVSGEISHRQDMPVQINGSEVIAGFFAALGQGSPTTFSSRVVPGQDVPGWDTFDMSQAQVTLLRTFNRVMGASRLVLVGEAGYSHLHGNLSNHPYGRSTNYGLGNPGDGGFITKNAWGYRTRMALNYSNVFAGVNLTPTLSWSHDVSGVSPTGGSFNEGNKAIGLSLKGDYQQRYFATVSYTNYFGGDFNTIEDRDFLSTSIGMSF